MSDAELLGKRLRAAREARDMSLEETERATRIRAKFIEALENGDYTDMSRVQAQGFLRNYARYLGLDIELLVDEIAGEKGRGILGFRGSRPASPSEIVSRETQDTTPLPPPPSTPAAPRSPARASRRLQARRRGVLGNIVIILIAGGLVSALVIGVTQLFDTLAEQENQPVLGPAITSTALITEIPVMTSDSPEGVSTPDPLASDSPLTETPSGVQPAQPTPQQGYTPPPMTGTAVTVVIEIVQDTWIQITTDGVEQFAGTAEVGQILNFTGQQSVGVRASNAAGLKLMVNNMPQGVLGARGELFDHTFTLNNAVPGDGLQSGDTSMNILVTPIPPEDLMPSTATAFVAVPPASPSEATLFVTPDAAVDSFTPLTPLDPGDGSLLVASTPHTPPHTLTMTLTSAATATLTPTYTPTIIPTITAIPTLTPTLTPTPTYTATYTATFTATITPIPPITLTVTPSPTATQSPTLLSTSTLTATFTASPTSTRTPTATPSRTPTSTATRTPTPTYTPSLTYTPSNTPRPSATPTQTPFLPPRFTRTPSPVPK